MLNVLVIGGAGFVGSHLCRALVSEGHVVTCFDNYFTGKRDAQIESVNYVEGETFNICNTLSELDFDLVYHLGEYSRVEQSFEDVDLVFRYNTQSLPEVLKFCRLKDSKIIYAGSSTKFGDNGGNQLESPYAWTKSKNTELVKVYCDWFDMKYAITYFYNVYGNSEISEGKYATLIGKYLHLYKQGNRELPVVLPGNQRRNFTDVEDIINALVLIGIAGNGDGFGIGSDLSYSVLEVVELFGCSPLYLPERKGNRLSAPVISEKTKQLGWEAKGDLKSYIESNLE